MNSSSLDHSDLYHATVDASTTDSSELIQQTPVRLAEKTSCGGKLSKKQAYCVGLVGVVVLACIIALGVSLTKIKKDLEKPRYVH